MGLIDFNSINPIFFYLANKVINSRYSSSVILLAAKKISNFSDIPSI